jgi:hypothetical protein
MTSPRKSQAESEIALVGCGSAKQDVAAPAKDLYTSGYFSLKRQYATQHCTDWRILSAKHGLVHPSREIEPYDASLAPGSDSYIGDDAVDQWVSETEVELAGYLAELPSAATVVVLAGENYAGRLEDVLESAEQRVEWPFRRDELTRMGDQMQWLSQETE